MTIGETLTVNTPQEWRQWLHQHYGNKSEIWLILYKKASGKMTISYDEAVAEALCYGWIDSLMKSLDKEKYAQRFSPRKPSSNLSEPNRQRIRELIKAKKMTKAGLAALAHIADL